MIQAFLQAQLPDKDSLFCCRTLSVYPCELWSLCSEIHVGHRRTLDTGFGPVPWLQSSSSSRSPSLSSSISSQTLRYFTHRPETEKSWRKVRHLHEQLASTEQEPRPP